MVFPTRKEKFLTILTSFNKILLKKNLNIIPLLKTSILPTLNNAWFLGITDGEGCFCCSLLSNSIHYRFKFILTQKWEANKIILKHILNLLKIYSIKGSVVPHSASDVWELRINGIKNCQELFNYFDTYTLITKKNQSYSIWKQYMLNY